MKYFFLALLPLFFACGNDVADNTQSAASAAAQESAYDVMMEGHDRVMPLMGDISRAQLVIADRLADENLAEEQRELLTAANEKLEDAGDGMMEWMQSIKPLDELRKEKDDEELVGWIEERTAKIGSVASMMTSSVAGANEMLGLTADDHSHGDGHDHDHGDGHDHNH